MGLGASGDDGRPSPADTDGGTGDANPSPLELVIDDELSDGIGIASPRAGPVWGNESTGSQRGPIGVWMGVQPDAYLEASRIVVGRKSEVHGFLPVGEWCSGDPRDQSLEKGGVGLETEGQPAGELVNAGSHHCVSGGDLAVADLSLKRFSEVHRCSTRLTSECD